MSKLSKVKELFRKRFELKKQFSWMIGRTRPYAGKLIFLILVDVAISAVSMGCTLMNKRLIDNALSMGFDTRGLVVLIVLTLFSIGLGALSGVLSRLVNEQYATGIRADVFRRTMRAGWKPLSALHSEDALTRITADVDAVASGIAELLPGVIYLVVRLLMAFVILYSYDHYLALTALLLGPLCVAAGWLFSGKLKNFETALKKNNAVYRAFMQESVSNIAVLKAFQREEAADERLSEIRGERLELVRKRNVFSTVVNTVMGLVFRIGYLLAFFWGIWQISQGKITYGTMSVFLALVSQVQSPVLSIYQMMGQLIGVLASVDRVMELENLPAEAEAKPVSLKGPVGLRVEQVNFSYDRDPVLLNASMEIRPGECVGLVGESGIGKTTLARLLLALISPERGKVFFYDENGHEETASVSTRALIAYVPQGNTLSSGTLRENLMMARKNATDEELWQALEIAQAAAFIRALPEGLDSRIGEKGIGISEGQAQRVAIARALLRPSPFLILDEATASLDVENEREIMENLKKSTLNRTCLIITHRPSLLNLCTCCYRVRDGKVEKAE